MSTTSSIGITRHKMHYIMFVYICLLSAYTYLLSAYISLIVVYFRVAQTAMGILKKVYGFVTTISRMKDRLGQVLSPSHHTCSTENLYMSSCVWSPGKASVISGRAVEVARGRGTGCWTEEQRSLLRAALGSTRGCFQVWRTALEKVCTGLASRILHTGRQHLRSLVTASRPSVLSSYVTTHR